MNTQAYCVGSDMSDLEISVRYSDLRWAHVLALLALYFSYHRYEALDFLLVNKAWRKNILRKNEPIDNILPDIKIHFHYYFLVK